MGRTPRATRGRKRGLSDEELAAQLPLMQLPDPELVGSRVTTKRQVSCGVLTTER